MENIDSPNLVEPVLQVCGQLLDLYFDAELVERCQNWKRCLTKLMTFLSPCLPLSLVQLLM